MTAFPAQSGQPSSDYLLQPLRQVQFGDGCLISRSSSTRPKRPGGQDVADQFADEEGVAPGPTVEVLYQLRGYRRIADSINELGDFRAGEASQADCVEGLGTHELSDNAIDRVIRGHILLSIRSYNEHGNPQDFMSEEAEEAQAAVVRPLQVVKSEDGRRHRRGGAQQVAD